jgi:hypothetical protein
VIRDRARVRSGWDGVVSSLSVAMQNPLKFRDAWAFVRREKLRWGRCVVLV